MDPEDYFGSISVPENEEDEDAANDLTFGDTSDIKAGDDSSDAFWKPVHQSLSSQIEEEKNAINRARTLPEKDSNSSVEHNTPSWPTSIQSTTPLLQVTNPVPLPVPLQPTPQVHNQPIQFTSPHPLPEQLRSLSQNPNLVPLTRPTLPQHTPYPTLSPQSQQQQPLPQTYTQQTAQQTVSQDEYIRSLIAYEESRTKVLLQQHQETVKQQLQKALAAQQAGVSFDRGKFDEHQSATHQMILNDHNHRVQQQIRMVAWHRQRQQQQHLLHHRPVSNEQQQLQEKLQSDIADISLKQILPGHSPQMSTQKLQNGLAIQSAKDLSDFSIIVENGGKELINDDMNGRVDFAKTVSPQMIDRTPARLAEIERQMAEAGLGPKGKRSTKENMAQFALDSKQNGDLGQKQKSRERRLESMTDKDQELVFRVHLRQIESSVGYKDDYYNTLKRNKQKVSGNDMFHSMAKRVQDLRERARQSGRESKPFRNRRTKKSSTANGVHSATSSSPHADQNVKALANSLGTVQSWNPRAPRRVMDFGQMGKDEKSEPQRTLRDDERIFVKLEIERGYDVIACIHDIIRGESFDSLEAQMRLLKSTINLEAKSEHGPYLEDEHGRRIFRMMCSQAKGRLYLLRVVDLLDSIERIHILPALFANLGNLVSITKVMKSEDIEVSSNLLDMMMRSLYDSDLHAIDCVGIIEAFYLAHCMSTSSFTGALQNRGACKLLFTCAQKVSRALQKNEIMEDDLVNTKIDQLSETLLLSLPSLFKQAESGEVVWELIASIDSVLTAKRQKMYRSELSYLLSREAIPPLPSKQ